MIKVSKSDLLKLVLESESDEILIPEKFIIHSEDKIAKIKEPNFTLNTEDNSEDDYFNYIINDKYYIKVLKGKLTYPQYLKQKDEQYYYLLKVINTINKIVGYRVIPKIAYSKFKELNDTYSILEAISDRENLGTKGTASFKYLVKPSKDHTINTFTNHVKEGISPYINDIVADYCKFDTSYISTGIRFLDMLNILATFLKPTELLLAIIRPALIRNPKTRRMFSDISMDIQSYKITSKFPVYYFEHRLDEFENELDTVCSTIDNYYIDTRTIDIIRTMIRDSFEENRTKQLIELAIPDLYQYLAALQNTFY